MRRVSLALFTISAVCALPPLAGASVLRVGSFHAIKGQFTSIQAAVKAARPGDWILVGPGDYKTKPSSISSPKGYPDFPAGVLITKRDLHIRGMNRNTVIVDGTKPGSARCSRSASAQNFGRATGGGASAGGYMRTAASTAPSGANGLMVWKARNVSIENLTACNFLGGTADAGNQIWWNGGANTGKVGGYGFHGAYLNTTSTFFKNEQTAATYGIFSSNWSGGTWDQTYASNFNDSGYYIGACQQICDQTLNHGHGEYNALGYSGSNSGGKLIVENSEFNNNEDGFDTNSQNGDNPPPQNGACPGKNQISPITGTHSCWVFMHNYVHDNNNPNVPSSGSAAAGPVGTGMSVSGARNDTIMHNRFVRNDAWGVIFVPYTDNGPPCTGGTLNSPILGQGSCLFDEYGDALLNNQFSHNGGYGNLTNGQFDQLNLEQQHPTDCFAGNTDSSGSLSADSTKLQQMYPACTGSGVAANINVSFLNEVLCDSQVKLTGFGCKPGDRYPRRTRVVMHPLPQGLRTMPNACKGVPANPWCRRKA
jgi:hypothetical protein